MIPGITLMSQAVIDQMEARLRVLDQQFEWLNGVISELEVHTPPTRPRINRAIPVGPIAPDLFLVESEDEEEQEWVDDSDEEEDDRVDLDSSVFTTFYHSERWGVHPRGADRELEWWEDGYESDDDSDSDAETVVYGWDDPNITPMKRLAPVAAEFYHNDSSFDSYLD
jgi:hypothetical protein